MPRWMPFVCLAVAAQAAPAVEDWLPQGAVMVVHVARPTALIDVAATMRIPGVQDLPRLSEGLSARLGTDWKGLIQKLAGGGIAWASYPGDTSVWVAEAESPAAMQPVQQFVRELPKLPYRQEHPGAVVFSLDGKQFLAIAGNRLVATNRPNMLKTLFSPRTGGGLASWPPYIAACKAAGEGVAATMFMNLALLKQAPPVQKALALDSPLDALLAGAVKQSVRGSSWMAAGVRVDGRRLLLHAVVDGRPDPSGAAAFTLPRDAAQGILPNLVVPNQLAAATLWRDLRGFYAARDALFPEKTSAAVLIENFMEIFFTGRDLTEEVFARFHPEVRLVVARQQYATGVPVEQYPAAALVFRVERPEEFGEIFEEAWQKAIGLVNFTKGQQAQPGLIIDKGLHQGVPYTYCYYSMRNEKDRTRLPSRFNVRPALARVGSYLILSSTDSLAKDVIDAVNREDGRVPAIRPRDHTILEVNSGAAIAEILRVNRAELVRQSVVKSGGKPEQAEAQFENNLALLNMLDGARLSFSTSGADLELRLK